MWRWLILAACLAPSTVVALDFEDVTAAAGLVYLQRAVPVTTNQGPEAAEQASGGAAAGDFDGDGWVDLVVSRGDAPPILFANNHDGTFRDVTAAAGDLAPSLPRGSNGVAWGDIDNDGDLDLYVTSMNTRRFHLFINRGDGSFSEEGQQRSAAVATENVHYGTGVAFGDYDRDGFLDIFVSEWRANPLPPEAPLPSRSHNRLLRNRGADAAGYFDDVTQAAGVEVELLADVPTSPWLGVPGYSPGFVDFDADGWPDLAWVADWGHSRLFWNQGDGTFRDGTVAAHVGRERSGMGSTQADFNGDGRIDWYATSIFGRVDEIPYGVSNQLYLNNGDRTFANTSAGAGVADGGFGWGTSAFDFDNDGDVDIVATNGFLAPGHPEEGRWAADQTRLFRNRGDAVFDEIAAAAGISDSAQGKGLLTFDYDRDGDLDVFVVNHAGAPLLYRNNAGNQRHWLQIALQGVASNRFGIGAVIRLVVDAHDTAAPRTKHLLANSNFLSQDEPLAHFGLGGHSAPIAKIVVQWPSGIEQIVENVVPNQRLTIRESRVPEPRFVDVTASAGLSYEHGYLLPLASPDGSYDEARHVAGGVAAGDYDNDGWVDLYMIRGDIGANLLFRNRGDGSFEEVAAAAGVALSGTSGCGPLFADVDGDGHLDLFVGGVRGTRPALFRNLGHGTFADALAGSGLNVTRDTYSAAMGDYDRDGDLDLALSHWNSELPDDESSQTLWRNDGDFHFTDVSDAAGIKAHLQSAAFFGRDMSFTPNFADIDNDGWPDLLMASDFGTSLVLRNRRDGTFANLTDRQVINDENGMGAAIGDFDGDGNLDWFVSSIWDPNGVAEEHWGVSGNRLYRGLGNGTFADVTSAAGVRDGYWGWGSTFADFNNDGHLDIFHANGWGRAADYLPSQEFFADPLRLFVANGDSTFAEKAVEAGLLDEGLGRGVVAFDYDRDGDIDLFVTNNRGPARLFRNAASGTQHFLSVDLRAASGSPAIGARAYVETSGHTQMRELRAGSNFESQDPSLAHFGLGNAGIVDRLRVVWPDGAESEQNQIAADQYLIIVAPTPTPTPTGTPTPPPTPMPTPTPRLCPGDCNGDQLVSLAEILQGVAAALDRQPSTSCGALEIDSDGHVGIDELVRAVGSAHGLCLAAD